MSVETKGGVAALAEFVVGAAPPLAARERAAAAIRDTVGVILAGSGEPAARACDQLTRMESIPDARQLTALFQPAE